MPIKNWTELNWIGIRKQIAGETYCNIDIFIHCLLFMQCWNIQLQLNFKQTDIVHAYRNAHVG